MRHLLGLAPILPKLARRLSFATTMEPQTLIPTHVIVILATLGKGVSRNVQEVHPTLAAEKVLVTRPLANVSATVASLGMLASWQDVHVQLQAIPIAMLKLLEVAQQSAESK